MIYDYDSFQYLQFIELWFDDDLWALNVFMKMWTSYVFGMISNELRFMF
jgi:hypothetical protein